MRRHFYHQICLFGLILYIVSCSGNKKKQNIESQDLLNLTQYVDPFIGTGDHGHVFMGANVPFGAVQLGPTQFSQGWDWCSGYHYSDSTIIGFSHTHLSGTGSPDLGDISLMPAVGDVKLTRGNLEDETSGIYSKFSHENEVAKAGYYKVSLDRFNIDVELTTTQRVGFHKYTFPKTDEAKVIIDLEHGIGDESTETYIVQENDTTISGYRSSRGWIRDHRLYFTATFSKPMTSFYTSDSTSMQKGKALKAKKVYGLAHFKTQEKEAVLVKVAISAISIENAKMNMKAELSGWDFNKTKQDADEAWNKALNKIKITSNDNHIMRSFYTSFYHTMVAPSVYSDVNGDYMGTDKKVHSNNDFMSYSTFSLWDTYRAAHPLMNLVHSEMVPDIAKTMMHIYNEQGKLPIWHMMSYETYAMVGNPGAVVLADIVLKGYDVDNHDAFEAMKASAMLDERGLKWLKQYGYIPYEKEYSSVAKALEYGLADWSIAQVAKKLGKQEDYNYFIKRSKSYKHYFDPEMKLLRPIDSNKIFKKPFNPMSLSDYIEGNAWQYTWLVPHNVNGLVNLFGSEKAFITQLDSLFSVNEKLGHAPDVTGLIGQYAHGNEPSHHILYMYPYVGQPWKTADKVREVLNTLYSDKPAGISGNEDVGQMSAWYILSSLGMYQVAPAGGDYVFGSPIIDEAILNVGNSKTLKIIAKNNSVNNKYIQGILLNGEDYTKSYISFKDLKAGGTLEFEMGAVPSKTFGVAKADRPASKD
ncbi:GH92 family glycosyl hydrolase [Flavivirga rizhaonensis]|uniref:Glycoside hydrolase family 92 protein n=1 Tax=Flavivirga rizhaonensis TaxID=2559571 RepID=A0A4S1E2I6_9FLAO|nr:GH92 family glycosyl hydrolase [Flavivirga rizhaonensis]TGV04615.1 glycoside hydrolase family 92 protein [Flavivirga rizhaonensis]